jgi:hypothetical protein
VASLWAPRLARDRVPGRHQQQRLGLQLVDAPQAKPSIRPAVMMIQPQQYMQVPTKPCAMFFA